MMKMRHQGAWVCGLALACGPAGPEQPTASETSEGSTSTSTSTGTTGEPTTGAPTTGTSSTTLDPTTSEPPECDLSQGYDCGPCADCVDGQCIDNGCGHYNECDSDFDCGEGSICVTNFDFVCMPIPPLRACDQQTLALSLVETEGAGGALLLADLDGDGDLDVALARAGEVEVQLGDGAGGLALGGVFSTGLGAGPQRAVAGDFDGDGEPDLAVLRDAPAGELALLFGQDAVFAAPIQDTFAAAPAKLWLGDVDGDGIADLLAHSTGGGASLSLRRGDGVGGFMPEVDAYATPLLAPAGADVQGAALLDVVHALDIDPPTLEVLRWDGAAFAPISTVFGAGTTAYAVAGAADSIGGVGAELLALRSLGGVTSLTEWFMGAETEVLIGAAQAFGGALDVDGDGRRDVVTYSPGVASASVHFRGQDGLACTQVYALDRGFPLTEVAAGDLDGDGKADLVAAGEGTSLQVLRSGP